MACTHAHLHARKRLHIFYVFRSARVFGSIPLQINLTFISVFTLTFTTEFTQTHITAHTIHFTTVVTKTSHHCIHPNIHHWSQPNFQADHCSLRIKVTLTIHLPEHLTQFSKRQNVVEVEKQQKVTMSREDEQGGAWQGGGGGGGEGEQGRWSNVVKRRCVCMYVCVCMCGGGG